jgi:hypothetical protein
MLSEKCAERIFHSTSTTPSGEHRRRSPAIGQKNQVREREKSGKYLMFPEPASGKLILLIEC